MSQSLRGWGWVVGAGLAATLWASSLSAQERPQGQPRQPDADEMFRTLDTNRDGKITSDDATDRNRTFLERVFQQAGKERSGTISRDEFRTLVETVRRNGAPPQGNRPPGNRPPGDRPAGDRPSGDRPPPNSPATGRPPTSSQPPARGERPAAGDRPTSGDSRSSIATSSTGRGDSAPGANPRANRLAGVWRGWVVDGRGDNPNAGHMQMELRIEGTRLTAREIGGNRGGGGEEGLGSGTFVATAEGNSGNLDATGTTGRYDGVEYLGIFEVDGDTLKWCVGNRGKQRPREFATERGNYYMILRRENAR